MEMVHPDFLPLIHMITNESKGLLPSDHCKQSVRKNLRSNLETIKHKRPAPFNSGIFFPLG